MQTETASMLGRAVKPWKALTVDIMSMGTTFRADKNFVLFVIDRALRSPFGTPLPSKEIKDVSRILANQCLTFEVPGNFSSDGGGDFRS